MAIDTRDIERRKAAKSTHISVRETAARFGEETDLKHLKVVCVLHGTAGLNEEMLKKCLSKGVRGMKGLRFDSVKGRNTADRKSNKILILGDPTIITNYRRGITFVGGDFLDVLDEVYRSTPKTHKNPGRKESKVTKTIAARGDH